MTDKSKVIGILGGGQLAKMTIDAAHKLGYKVHVFSDKDDSVAFKISDYKTKGAFSDLELIKSFAESVAVITYEFENIPKDTVVFLEQNYNLRPNAKALEICQKRNLEKTFVNMADIATAKFKTVSDIDDIEEFLSTYGSAILKTNSLGYDGKGQYVLESVLDVAKIGDLDFAESDFIIEEKLDFESEISVLIARNSAGDIEVLPITRNFHEDGILDYTSYPSGLENDVLDRAREIAKKIANLLDYIGILAVEIFVMPDNSLLVNELAPRPHNTGHWTIDACNHSQFELFVLAITDQDLPEVVATHESGMVNLLGEEINNIEDLKQSSDIIIHDYGKGDAKPGRKMGHYTILRDALG
ncbi:MAG: 5-(carboxyamino)imidazole ribonucleotide synthase [Rickettsiales bacterium]|jgi:5-(carboxyamino)imidazole ribonucleotide synthase|nr:5-(carboxyamino)imidazole ribonucleotide synthase [Rickettsiales bacterium]